MAKSDFPEKIYSTLDGGWVTCASIQQAVNNSTKRVQVAEYQLVKVVEAAMVVDIKCEVG